MMHHLRHYLAWLLCTLGALCCTVGWLMVPVLLGWSWWWAPVVFLAGIVALIAHVWVDETQY